MKTHLKFDYIEEEDGGPLIVTWCNRQLNPYDSSTTRQPASVTCKQCIRASRTHIKIPEQWVSA